MASTTQSASGSRDSQAPLVNDLTSPPAQGTTDQTAASEERTRKRDFFRFSRKEDEKKKAKSPTTATSQLVSAGGLRPASPLAGVDTTRSPASPARNSPYGVASSPRGMRSASPRTHSPASSMIFERNVQEDVAIPQASPQIPSHIITENHIPPALDATSEAITDKKLDPDTVEIVTHATHQPASVTISSGLHDAPISPVMSEELHPPVPAVHRQESAENTSNYASLDSVDVRRLSFISFADVVHAEHDFADGRRDSTNITSHPSIGLPRSPSPMRSPVSSSAAIGTSPPTSVSPSVHEASPHRATGELNIETMRQALRKTGSGDLSGVRSAPLSAIGNDDGTNDRSFR
ncbi:hypothetical protein H2198_005765 [Neophaeococcomyces mojaviensis]|uniref:Uncharacterized protein n=1 Tax=Neophaeococcomyces mojaviensis TaxID=3383035 RepID=A0ACC3A504_9EURO|nr:hypothetical protein H2198_005765 [Knufia sp. JES_112]